MIQRIKRFLSEPFLHFLLIGLVIFISSSYISKKREIHKIIIDKSVISKAYPGMGNAIRKNS